MSALDMAEQEEDTYMILWRRPDDFDREWEKFDTLKEALGALGQWSKNFPYNTYTLVKVERVVKSTAPLPPPVQW